MVIDNMAHELQALLIISLCYLVGYSTSKSCYSNDPNPYKHFASKTAYDEIRGFSAQEYHFNDCTPKQFYLVARHGTRYPKTKEIVKMRTNLPNIKYEIIIASAIGKSKLCKRDIDNLKAWEFKVEESLDEKLAPTGEKEFVEMGSRFKNRFPSIFNLTNSSSSTFDVRATNTERAKSSAKYFLKGLMGDEGMSIPISEDVNLLRFYKSCPQWKRNVDDSSVASIEAVKFQRGKMMTDLRKDITKRLGLKKDLLTAEDISLMYDMCRFQSAWEQDRASPWCAVFKSDNLRVLEYGEDLKYYYKHGYGHSINYKQACPPVKDMVDNFRAKMQNSTSNKTDILLRFSHSGMMLKLYARLGIFKDAVPLLASNYQTQKNRKWKTSEIDSFAANIAFILLKCDKEFKVATFFQEKEIQLPHCSSSPCPMDEFLKPYQEIADNCDLESICKI